MGRLLPFVRCPPSDQLNPEWLATCVAIEMAINRFRTELSLAELQQARRRQARREVLGCDSAVLRGRLSGT
jgi:hypothetical protein